MEDLMFNLLHSSSYYGIVTVLNYEIRLNKCLSNLSFPPSENEMARKIIVDLALKSGMNQYRFAEFPINKQGKIDIGSFNFATVDSNLEQEADGVLRECKEIVLNSMLPTYKKEELIAR